MAANVNQFSPAIAFGGKVPSAQLNGVGLQAAQSVNRNNTVTGSKYLPIRPFAQHDGTNVMYLKLGSGCGLFTYNTATGDIYWPIEGLPRGHLLTGVTLHIQPTPGHGGQPAQLPEMRLYKEVNTSTTPTLLGSATHTWVDVGTYDAGFSYAITLSETINPSTTIYMVGFILESGVNSAAGLVISNFQAHVTVDNTEGGPDYRFW